MRNVLVCSLSLAMLVAAPVARAHEDGEAQGKVPEKLGTVAFENSCAPSAQQSFQRGVALLHSFWFIEGE